MTTKVFVVFFVLALAGCSREAENQTAQNMVTQFTGTWYSADMGYKFTFNADMTVSFDYQLDEVITGTYALSADSNSVAIVDLVPYKGGRTERRLIRLESNYILYEGRRLEKKK